MGMHMDEPGSLIEPNIIPQSLFHPKNQEKIAKRKIRIQKETRNERDQLRRRMVYR
jgi:hypothetical protein